MKCIVNGCNSRQYRLEYISYHCLFREGKYEENWIEAIRSLNGQEIQNLRKNMFICCKHFDKSFIRNLGGQYRLVPNAIPTIFPNQIEEIITLDSPILTSNIGREDSIGKYSPIEEITPDPIPISHLVKEEIDDQSYAGDRIVIEDATPKACAPQKWDSLSTTPDMPNKILNRSSLRSINLEKASPQTLKKLNSSLINSLRKKTKTLKLTQRDVQEKNKRIQHLKALVVDLKNQLFISETKALRLQKHY